MKFIKKIGDITLIREIGHGSYGKVYEANDKQGTKLAIKMVSRVNLKPSLEKYLQDEAAILSSFHHPNIVKLVDLLKTTSNYYFVFEYCDKGDLEQFRMDFGGKLDEPTVQYYAQQICNAMQALHKKGIMHRDIKLANVFLTSSTGPLPVAKLGDFGFATYVKPENSSLEMTECSLTNSYMGTPLNMSPEMMNKSSYNYQSDIWSLGCIIFLLFNGEYPFVALTKDTLLEKVMKGDYTIRWTKRPSAYIIDFLQKCLQSDIKKRIHANELVKHPFLNVSKDELLKSAEYMEMTNKTIGDYHLSTKAYHFYFSCEKVKAAPELEIHNEFNEFNV